MFKTVKVYHPNLLKERKNYDGKENVNLKNYESSGSVDIDFHDNNINAILEGIFVLFNTNKSFSQHWGSLSMGDIVKVDNSFYYCNDIGWKSFVPAEE